MLRVEDIILVFLRITLRLYVDMLQKGDSERVTSVHGF